MNHTTLLRLTAAGALMLASALVHADPCKLQLTSNDQMQFSVRELVVPAECTEVEVTLRHVQLSAKAMGHDWVLAKDSTCRPSSTPGLPQVPPAASCPSMTSVSLR